MEGVRNNPTVGDENDRHRFLTYCDDPPSIYPSEIDPGKPMYFPPFKAQDPESYKTNFDEMTLP